VPPSSADPSAASSPPEDTEERILEAAHRVFLRRGVSGSRTQDIADEADVNRALLHYYFRTKERLAQAVFLRAARSFFPRLLSKLASDLPLREKLRQAIETQLELLTANPYLPGYLIAEFQYRPGGLRELLGEAIPVERLRNGVLDALQAQIDAEVEAGRMRPTPAVDFVVTLHSLVIYPFVAAPMLDAALGLGSDARDAMMERRRATLPDDLLRLFAP
jgi:AcrR family transcriptional regulator